MNRRRFLGLFGLGAAGVALEHAIPFGRVWSFPKEIVIADPLCDPLSLYGLQYWRDYPRPNATFFGVEPGVSLQLFGGYAGSLKRTAVAARLYSRAELFRGDQYVIAMSDRAAKDETHSYVWDENSRRYCMPDELSA